MAKRTTERLLATRWHEAGHTVAAKVLKVDQVTCKPQGIAGKREQRAAARRCIIATYAGMEAEKLFQPDAIDWHGDDENAFELSRQWAVIPRGSSVVGDDAHRKYLEKLRRESRRLVYQYRLLIKGIVEAPVENRKLKGPSAAKCTGLSSTHP